MGGGSEGPDGVTLVASSLSGATSRVFCHPLDTCKARLQVQTAADGLAAGSGVGGSGINQQPYRGLVDALSRTLRQDGITGLYRGFGVTFVGSVPAMCLYLGTYEYAKSALAKEGSALHGSPFCTYLAAGMAAETVSCSLWVPVDVLKERQQVEGMLQRARGEPVVPVGLRTLVSRGGGLPGMYKGFFATLGSFGPYSALYFGFYEELKKVAVDAGWGSGARGEDGRIQLPFEMYLATSSAAAAGAAFWTSPLDMVKLRLQVQRGEAAASAAAAASGAAASGKGSFSFQYSGFLSGLADVARREGARGLWRGVGARIAFMVPSQTLGMSFYEQYRVVLLKSGYFASGDEE